MFDILTNEGLFLNFIRVVLAKSFEDNNCQRHKSVHNIGMEWQGQIKVTRREAIKAYNVKPELPYMRIQISQYIQ